MTHVQYQRTLVIRGSRSTDQLRCHKPIQKEAPEGSAEEEAKKGSRQAAVVAAQRDAVVSAALITVHKESWTISTALAISQTYKESRRHQG